MGGIERGESQGEPAEHGEEPIRPITKFDLLRRAALERAAAKYEEAERRQTWESVDDVASQSGEVQGIVKKEKEMGSKKSVSKPNPPTT